MKFDISHIGNYDFSVNYCSKYTQNHRTSCCVCVCVLINIQHAPLQVILHALLLTN